jgi:hypothetical protein
VIFRETVAALLHMRWLEHNWDSYGGREINRDCINKAIETATKLDGHWQPVPLGDGSVQLEQHEGGFDIEITIRAAVTSTGAT